MTTTQPTKSPSLATLVDRWAEVVAEVERGYTLTFDDYLNDIDLRHLIARSLRNAPPQHIVAMAPLLYKMDTIDAKFREMTEIVDECIWGEANANDERWSADTEWYYYRQPQTRPSDW
jgi:hypothetical protein